jgi:hydrogenase maturation protein HypF
MGSDGNIWGGEFMVADYSGFNRVAHLQYLPLPGGDAAVRRPYRIAIAYILSLLGEDSLKHELAFLRKVSELEMEVIKRQVERKLNSPLTSSMGRLFDAVSALTGIRDEIDYEGQAAVELEMAAYPHYDNEASYPYHIVEDNRIRIIQLDDLLSTIIQDLRQGVSPAVISIKFHNTIAQMTNQMCQMIARDTGIKQVALSGGVFQNRLLLRKAVKLLENTGFQVYTHKQVPCNDGGISLGQAVIANFTK